MKFKKKRKDNNKMKKEEIKNIQENIIKEIINKLNIDKDNIEYDENNNIKINNFIKTEDNEVELNKILYSFNRKNNNIKFYYEINGMMFRESIVEIYYIVIKEYKDKDNKDNVIIFEHVNKSLNRCQIRINRNNKYYDIRMVYYIHVYNSKLDLVDNINEIKEIKQEINNIIIEYILDEYLNNSSEYINSNIDNYKNIINEIIYS